MELRTPSSTIKDKTKSDLEQAGRFGKKAGAATMDAAKRAGEAIKKLFD